MDKLQDLILVGLFFKDTKYRFFPLRKSTCVRFFPLTKWQMLSQFFIYFYYLTVPCFIRFCYPSRTIWWNIQSTLQEVQQYETYCLCFRVICKWIHLLFWIGDQKPVFEMLNVTYTQVHLAVLSIFSCSLGQLNALF